MNSAYRAEQRRPKSAGPVVNLNKVKAAAPSWTFRGKPKLDASEGGAQAVRPRTADPRCGPGPGYDPVRPEAYRSQRAPSFSIGAASRKGIVGENSDPGPGEFDADAAAKRMTDRRLPGGSFGKEARKLSAGTFESRPAFYDVKSCFAENAGMKGPGRSFSSPAIRLVERTPNPGPGEYSLPKPPKAGRGGVARWGRPPRVWRVDDVPGPGHYSVGARHLRQKPTHSFGLAILERDAPLGAPTPGPGDVQYTSFARPDVRPDSR